MTIKHKFVSQKQDGADETLVRPSDWNDDHVGSPVDIQIFTESGTWTKPAGCTTVFVVCIGGGGGGGSGTYTAFTSHRGGIGGGGGSLAWRIFPASLCDATETITVGAGGPPGALGDTVGGTGGTSSFGSLLSALGGAGYVGGGSARGRTLDSTSTGGKLVYGGAGCNGGTTFSYVGGTYTKYFDPIASEYGGGGGGWNADQVPDSSRRSAPAYAGACSAYGGGGGGGAGSGLNYGTPGAPAAGGISGSFTYGTGGGGAAGTVGSINGVNGADGANGFCGAGGGGGYHADEGGTAGNGGNGGAPAGGGGGGGAIVGTSGTRGTGGTGGRGELRVVAGEMK